MMRVSHPAATIIAGALSALLFALPGVLADAGQQILPLMPFFSALPLFTVGFLFSAHAAAIAGVLACIGIVPLSSLSYAAFFGLTFAVPTVLYVWKFHSPLHPSLKEGGMVAWTPLTQIIVAIISLYVVLQIFVSVGLFQYTNEYGTGMSAFFHEALIESARLQEMPADQIAQLEKLEDTMPILHGLAVWMVALLLLGNAAVGHHIASAIGSVIRPHLRLDTFHYPAWVLVALMLAGIAAFFGSPLISYIGQVAFMLYLLPYLISGMQPLHGWVEKWPLREIVIAAAYVFIIMSFWLALLVALYAVIKQCIFVSKTLTAA